MNKLRFTVGAAIIAVGVTGSAFGQKKPRKVAPRKTPTTQTLIAPLDVRAAREKVDIQLSNVNGFLVKLGPLAVNLETAVADSKANRLSPATAAKVAQGEERVITSIRDLRLSLSTLESEFRAKPVLQKYLANIQGITELGAQAEDAATQGRFVAAKEPLRKAAQKLTDTLAVLPR